MRAFVYQANPGAPSVRRRIAAAIARRREPPGYAARTGAVHAAEGLYAPNGNPVLALMTEEGTRAGATASTLLQPSPRDLGARGEALYCAWLCGSVLGATTMVLHHKLCPTLGGSLKLPHAGVHTVQTPYPNPRALERATLRALLKRALDGAAPQA